MAGYVTPDLAHATLLQGTSAINCKGGVIGGNIAGAPRDTAFYGCFIAKNATAASLTITGFTDSNGAAQSWVLSGSTTADTTFTPPAPILNDAAPMTFTPSIAGVVWVFTRSYTGG